MHNIKDKEITDIIINNIYSILSWQDIYDEEYDGLSLSIKAFKFNSMINIRSSQNFLIVILLNNLRNFGFITPIKNKKPRNNDIYNIEEACKILAKLLNFL